MVLQLICYFKGELRLFNGLRLLFLQKVPGATFIQGGTFIPESRVPEKIWRFTSVILLYGQISQGQMANFSASKYFDQWNYVIISKMCFSAHQIDDLQSIDKK